jgi:hypothetical protein
MMDRIDFWQLENLEHEFAPVHIRKRMLSKHDLDRRLAVSELGRSVCFMGGGDSAPSPDPNVALAAMKNAETGEAWLDFAKDQFKQGNIRQDQMDALTKTVVNQQLDTQTQANEWAQEDRARTKEVFQPIENEFIETAKNYDTPEKQAAAAAAASADVQKASATQTEVQARNMASMGLSPASGRFQGVTRADTTNVALASAGAQNNARQIVRDKGLALKADAINMGKGLPSSTAAAYGIGTQAGNSAVGNQSTANSNFYQNSGVMDKGYSGAMQGYSNQGNILTNLYGQQVNAWGQKQSADAQSSAGTGAMVGTVVGAGIMVF